MDIILGATHGLGEQLARQLKSQGREIFSVGRSYDESKHGAGIAIDLLLSNEVDELCRKIDELDVSAFYWVAGYRYSGDFADQQNPLRMAQVNFANALPVAQVAWQKMSVTENSNLVVVSSTSGTKARANEAIYAATKYAQVGFARSLGLEAERLKLSVKVSLFMPGGMKTPFWGETLPENYESYLDPARVAAEIIKDTKSQASAYHERTIERGGL